MSLKSKLADRVPLPLRGACRGQDLFSVEKGEIVGVVGESGAGKSTIGNAVIDLLSPPGRIARGDIYLNGELISGKSQNEMRAIRGSRIGFIFRIP